MKRPVKLAIPSDPKYLCLTRSVLQQLLSLHETPEDVARKIVLCVDEACSNIIKYGYGGRCEDPIEISFAIENDTFTVKIRDYGKQCDAGKIKPRKLDEVKPGGLGTFFINEIMDTVHYCTKREKGTLLTMTKKLKHGAAAPGIKNQRFS